MDGHAKLEPGWLAKEMREAPSDAALIMSPAHYCATTGRALRQLDVDDARRLREKMAKRYAAWTGRDLTADLRAE